MPIRLLSWLCLTCCLGSAQQLVLTYLGPATVHEGELIPVKLDFRGVDPKAGTAGNWGFSRFIVDPPVAGCEDRKLSCNPQDMWTFQKFDAMVGLGQNNWLAETDMNTRMPALPPGRYSIRGEMVRWAPGSRQYVTSNPVRVEVIPASSEWVRRTLEQIRRDMAGDYRDPQPRAARQLGFLYLPAAYELALELYRTAPRRDLLFGIYRNPNEAQSCELLRTGLRSRERKITGDYIWLYANVCHRAKPALSTERDLRVEAIRTLASRARDPGERAEVLRYVAEQWMQGDSGVPEFARPALEATVRDLASYSPQEIAATLSEFWWLLRNEPIRPVLEAVLKNDAFVREWVDARRTALRLLIELDPAAGPSALMQELREFRPTFNEELARLLPASAVPPMDDALLEHLRADPGTSLLIAYYLTPAARDRMKRVFESQADRCQPEMTAYFLRVDPAYGEQILKSATGDMHAPVNPCIHRLINRLPQLIMTPAVERFLIAHLQHENVYVKADAARLLLGFGSAAAKQPLWDSWNYFHAYWKGKEAELNNPDYRDGRFLEEMLRRCIARGRGWFVDEKELRRLGAMCLTERCRIENREDLGYWEHPPLPVEIAVNTLDIQARVAQIYSLGGLDKVRDKLAQFPKGTEFQLSLYGSIPAAEREKVAAGLRDFCASKGLVLHLTPALPSRGQ